MIRMSVDVAVDKPGIVTKRAFDAGTVFPIGVMVEAVGAAPVVFDTIVVEVFFNDGTDAVLSIDEDERPIVGDLAGRKTADALSGEPVTAGRLGDDPPLSAGSQLAMSSVETHAIGPFTGRTGIAGIRDTRNPFVLLPGAAPRAFAYGRVTAGLERKGGTASASILATGIALYRSEPVAVQSVRSTVRVRAARE